MKTCWQVLGIEATTDTDAIRQAYLALLPSFHPETDPQGFKQLREAYENALQGTTSPAITVVDEDPDTPWVNYLREIFVICWRMANGAFSRRHGRSLSNRSINYRFHRSKNRAGGCALSR
ncbi:molecular chaperone [Salmonella enterica subsp. enterica]|uniref:Molecular chaperone n=1 Tax=Salmonella enterica I TaxID=59201 RepID=A0A379WE24_SALET|nr:molecular chaperone [Salmonella enterica subsp. enterica]